ncbi:hypothetical protein EDD17DRAFT_1685796, partial [Pisolithus thermaeus]
MAAIGKLYTLPGVGRPLSYIKATAAVAGVEPEEPIYKHYEDDEMPELLAKFPCGRIPTFEGTNGFNLTEGAAIARYIASVAPNSGLPGDTVEGTALIDQYVRFAETEYKCPFSSSIYCKTDISLITRPFTQHLLRVNPEVILLTRAYLVDERLTLADIAVASV